MGPVASFKTCTSKVFRMQGRASRSEFWWFMILVVPAALLAEILISALVNAVAGYEASLTTAMVLGVILGLGAFIATITVTIRRLHDRDASGWMYIVIVLGSIVLGMIPVAGWALDLAFNIGVLIYFMFRGTVGPNRFGPDPLEATAPPPAA